MATPGCTRRDSAPCARGRSSSEEPLQRLVRHRFARDVFHARRGRALAQPALQPVERFAGTAGQHLDAAIGEILRVTGHAELERLLARGGAEKHALHAAADDEARARHQASPANSFAKGTSRSRRSALLASTMISRAASGKPTS